MDVGLCSMVSTPGRVLMVCVECLGADGNNSLYVIALDALRCCRE